MVHRLWIRGGIVRTPCQDNPELWVADYAALRREAADLCKTCPIIADCLAGAIERRETSHVWGGFDFSDPRTRPPLKPRDTTSINHGTSGGYRKHYRLNVPMCDDCRRAESLRKSSPKAAA